MRIRKGLTDREKEIISLINKDKYTIKQIAYRLKTSVQYVYKTLKKLEKEGSIIKKDSGLILNQKERGSQKILNQNDYYRLHNVELLLKCLRINVLKIKKQVLKDINKYNVRIGGQSKNIFFTINRVDLMITNKNNLYLFYPKDFEVIGNNMVEIWKNFDFEYTKDAKLLEKHFKILFHKKNRINYEFINRHISLVNNGIAKELRNDKISNEVIIKDDQDNKIAYMFDLSKGFNELESPHPNKAEHYIFLASKLMDFVKRGGMNKIITRSEDIEHFFKDYDNFKKEFDLLKESSLMFLNKEAHNIKFEDINNKPSYIG